MLTWKGCSRKVRKMKIPKMPNVLPQKNVLESGAVIGLVKLVVADTKSQTSKVMGERFL